MRKIAAAIGSTLLAGALVIGPVFLAADDPGEVRAPITAFFIGAAADVREHAERNDGRFPADWSELGEHGPEVATDPWGNSYGIDSTPTRGFGCRMFSLGADGAPGGQALDEDVVLWVALENLRVSYSLDDPDAPGTAE